MHCNRYRFGSLGAFLGHEITTWISGHIFFFNSSCILSVYYHARYDHGNISSYRFVPGRIWQYSYTVDVWSSGYGLSLCEHG